MLVLAGGEQCPEGSWFKATTEAKLVQALRPSRTLVECKWHDSIKPVLSGRVWEGGCTQG